ncbi:MAG: hypothetical protein CMO81_03175 [Waddliaceae bacterium]|nr:hypothetical protein [Waddliaceae bacterium]
MGIKRISRSVATHDGTFHADEVSACSLLLIFDLVDRDKIIRTRDMDLIDSCEFVCDVGGIFDEDSLRFDHHQVEYTGELSSAGMILQFLRRTERLNEDEYRFLYNTLIKGVDAHDNGKAPIVEGYYSFSNVISNFTPVNYDCEPEEQDIAFMEAVDFVVGHLRRMLNRFHYNVSCRELVSQAMRESDQCLVFDKALPWLENFFSLDGESHPANFLISPSGQHWKLRGIPPSYDKRMQVRVPLPESWAGLLGDELKEITGIEGAIFCHKGRFISVWQNKEDAMQAYELVMKMQGERTGA